MVHVIVFEPATAHSNARATSLLRMRNGDVAGWDRAGARGYELRTFECPTCRHFETAVGKIA